MASPLIPQSMLRRFDRTQQETAPRATLSEIIQEARERIARDPEARPPRTPDQLRERADLIRDALRRERRGR